MRVEFTTEGGLAYLPGLSKPFTLDSEHMSATEAEQLRQSVETVHFFDLPAQVGTAPAPGAADYHRYTIAIEENGKRHTVQLTDPVSEPALQQLLQFLKELKKNHKM